MQFEWLRFAPITNAVAAQYDVSVSAVGWLSLVFPLLFLPLALPDGVLIDRWSLRRSLSLVALVMLAGALLRVLIPGFTGLIAGQLLIALTYTMLTAPNAKPTRIWFVPAHPQQAA